MCNRRFAALNALKFDVCAVPGADALRPRRASRLVQPIVNRHYCDKWETTSFEIVAVGTTSADTMSAILNQDPPISQLAANHLPGLQLVISRCLQKNPEQRFHSAANLAFAIEALTDVPSATQPAALVRDSQALRWAKWMVAPALILAAVSIGLYLHRSSSTTGSRASPASSKLRALTESGKAARAAATPDGRYIAYVNNDAGNFELHLLQVATEREVRILSEVHQRIRSLHFSPIARNQQNKVAQIWVIIRRRAYRKRLRKNLSTVIDIEGIGYLQAGAWSDELVQIAHRPALFPHEGVQEIGAVRTSAHYLAPGVDGSAATACIARQGSQIVNAPVSPDDSIMDIRRGKVR